MTLVAAAFSGHLDVTILGEHLAARIAPVHFILGAVALLMGGAAAGQVIVVNYLTRLPEYATLRAIGWPRSAIARVLGYQGLVIVSLACCLCLMTTIAHGHVVAAPIDVIVVAGLDGAAAAAAAMVPGMALSLVELYRRSAARSFDED